MAKEKGMGKGLSALLGEDFSADFSTPSSTLPVSQIESCQSQPRKSFDREKLEELADSIRQHGLIQPLTVRKPAGIIRSSPESGGGGRPGWQGWTRCRRWSSRRTIRRPWSWL